MNAPVHKARAEPAAKQRGRAERTAPRAIQLLEVQLHRALGNRAYGQFVQAKLAAGAPNDPYEREASHVADRVMRIPDSAAATADRQAEPKEGFLQASASPGRAPTVPVETSAGIDALRGGGSPLGEAERAFFEPRFEADLSGVRVHTGRAAADLARSVYARAFTVGRDVVFGRGQYAPNTHQGRHLLAHELTHSIQQGAVAQPTRHGAGPRVAPRAAGHLDPIRRMPGPPALQRVRLTRGQFGKEMEHYQQEVSIPDRPFRLIARSSTFMNLVRTLDRHYVSLHEDTLPTWFEVGPDGVLLNDASLNGRWAPSGRHVIHLFTSGVDESSAFEPASRSAWPYDMMWLHDMFYWSPAIGAGMSEEEKDGTFIEALAHETTHAYNHVTGTGHGAVGPNPTLAASIAASVQEEIRTRQQEAQIVGEVQRGGRLRGFTPQTGSDVPREVERSMVSGTPRRTYLESFFFGHKLSQAIQQITDDEARSVERIVRGIPLSAATADQYLDQSEPIFYFDNSVGIYNIMTSEYGKWLFWQRVVHERWKAFEALANPPTGERERILQQHANAYFDSGIAYTP